MHALLKSFSCLTYTVRAISHAGYERDPDVHAVVQEACIQASNGFLEFRETDARVWLLTIIRNAACTWIQKCGNNSRMIPFEEAIHAAPSDEPEPALFHQKRN